MDNASKLKPYSLSVQCKVFLGLFFLLASVIVLALSIGAVDIPFFTVIKILLRSESAGVLGSPEDAIIGSIRLPRVLMGVLVGATLAICGAALQGLFRNPLADPALLGVSSGAALGAVTVIVLGESVLSHVSQYFGFYLLPVGAFSGGLMVTLIVYKLAASSLNSGVITLLLAGIAVGSLSSAGTGLLTYLADDFQLRTLTFWTMGSLGGATWTKLGVSSIFMLLVIIVIPLYANVLNALLLGESEAAHLGFNVKDTKRSLIVLVALGVGAAVSASGIIGFVGLITPHLVRMVLGPDHKTLLLSSALVGAILLLLADIFSRTVVSPSELPIGIVTTLIGGPFFIWLLIKLRREPGSFL